MRKTVAERTVKNWKWWLLLVPTTLIFIIILIPIIIIETLSLAQAIVGVLDTRKYHSKTARKIFDWSNR